MIIGNAVKEKNTPKKRSFFSRGTYLEFEDGNIARPIVRDRSWQQQRFHFDDVGKAMLTLFTVSTFEGWPS